MSRFDPQTLQLVATMSEVHFEGLCGVVLVFADYAVNCRLKLGMCK